MVVDLDTFDVAKGYFGNSNLKPAGVKIPMTPDLVSEYLKCAADPIYFIEKYYKIISVESDLGMVPFIMYEFQKDMVRSIIDNRFTIAKVPRQSGKTTIVAAAILWMSLFKKGYRIAILAHKHSQAREILDRIQKAYELLPKWIQQGVKKWNKGSIELENGSVIETAATGAGTIRGKTFNLVYLDELAHVQTSTAEDFFASVYPTISSGTKTKLVITSTPKGLNMFYTIWMKSVKGENDYHRIDVHWSDIPGRDEKWKEDQIRATSQAQFDEEFECNFLGSGNTLIKGTKLEQLTYLTTNPIVDDGKLRIFERVQPDHIYAATVDVARGVGGDYSAFIVFDVTAIPYRMVAAYNCNEISPLLLPTVIVQILRMFNNAHVLVETNDIGQQVADILHYDFEYEHVLMASNNGRNGQNISSGFGGATMHYGVRMTKPVKKLGCSNLKTLVEEDRLTIPSTQVVDELCHFISHKDSYAAEPPYHDDLSMCCVIFAWMVDQAFMKELTDQNIRLALKEMHSSQLEDDLTPIFVTMGYAEEESLLVDEDGMDGFVRVTDFDRGDDWLF